MVSTQIQMNPVHTLQSFSLISILILSHFLSGLPNGLSPSRFSYQNLYKLFKYSIFSFMQYYYYYYLVCEAIDTAATPGLLCQPRVIVKIIVEKQMECRLEGETVVLGENLPQRHFCPSQNPT
jgi:hypothetical protein